MESWSTATRFRSAFLVSGTVYVWEEEVGLKALREGGLRLVSGGRWFADQKVDALLPHPQGLLAIVRGEGLVLFTGGRVRRLAGTGSEYLQTHRPYTAISVPNLYAQSGSLYAVATFGGGVAVVAPDGRLVRVYREDVGISPEDSVVGLHLDRQGGLWVALLDGIARIDLFSRYSWFDEDSGLPGNVYSVAEVGGDVYAGTSTGLFRLTPGRNGRPGGGAPVHARFELVPEIGQEQTWATESVSGGLLAATNTGVYYLRGGAVTKVTPERGFTFLRVPSAPDRILMGSKDGVAVLDRVGGTWRQTGRVAGVDGETRSIVTGAGGTVWAAPLAGGLYRLSSLSGPTPTAEELRLTDGQPVTAEALVSVGDDVWMSPRSGVYEVSVSRGRLRLAPVLSLEDVQGVYSLFPDAGAVWFSQDGVFRPLQGRDLPQPEAPFELRGVQVTSFARLGNGVVWVATADGLLRYDPNVRQLETAYPAFVRRVTNGRHETIYAGALDPSRLDLRLPHDSRGELRFEAAALFGGAGATEYQFRLDGFDDEWGVWGPDRIRSFTNLPAGGYTLRVRARDAYGHVSEEAAFPFAVLPPWYETWWARGLYGLALVGLVWGASAWRIREHRGKLEAQRARSARLQRLSGRLEKMNDRLRKADKLKDDLLANTSHELRTPLTAVLGYSELLLESASDDVRTLAEGVQRGGQRLLSTVNGLLDMFKLQSGAMEVLAEPVDAAYVVRESALLLQPLADGRGLSLVVLPEGRPIPATVDVGLLDRVVSNLVSNAIKFTDAGRVLVLTDDDGESLQIVVRDTGIGIAPEDVDRMFEPFEQASTGFGRTHEGTGLGLAIVQQIVEQVGGRIAVESALGVGTTFTVTVPLHWGARAEGPVEPTYAALDGAHLLAIGLGPADRRTLRSWVPAPGTVVAADTLGRALREARRGAFDAVLVAAGAAEDEAEWVRAVREVPGYRHSPVVRVGKTLIDADELAARGFTHQTASPVGPEGAVLIESLLVQVEASVVG